MDNENMLKEIPVFITGECLEVNPPMPIRIVRCKNCQHYMQWGTDMMCELLDSYHGIRKPDDFCSYGVEKVK